jgi:predicted ATPase
MAAVEEGLALTQATGEGYWRSELYRLQGRCQLADGDADAAQASFRQALEVAQRQSAKSLELRAAMDLSDLWANQGQRVEAHELLAGVYGWFTEGFDTTDLRQAKARLVALAP